MAVAGGSSAPLPAKRRRFEEPLTLGVALLVVLVVAALPLGVLAAELIKAADEVIALLAQASLWILFLRSLALASLVTLGALLLGLPLGLLLARTDVRWPRLWWLLHSVPLFLPPLLLALGWFHVLGPKGLLGTETGARWLFGDAGTVAVMVLALCPALTGITGLAALSLDPALEEAARMVARPGRVAAYIVLPAVGRATGLGALLVFALAFTELGVPLFLRSRVYPEVVLARLGGIDYDPGEAVALTVPLLLAGAALVLLERSVFGRRRLALLGLRAAVRPPLPLGPWRWLATLGAAAVALAGLVPLLALGWRAWEGGGLVSLPAWWGRSPLNSLLAAALASLLAAVVAIPLALVRRRAGLGWVEVVLFFAFLAPAPVLGIGLIRTWNHSQTDWIYGTLAIVVLGAAARYTILALRTAEIALAQSSQSLEDAASVGGARYLRRLFGIVIPAHRFGLAGAILLCFVFCLRDLETAILFYPPDLDPLTVRIFTLEANGPESVVAALAVVQVLLAAAPLAMGLYLLGGPRR